MYFKIELLTIFVKNTYYLINKQVYGANEKVWQVCYNMKSFQYMSND